LCRDAAKKLLVRAKAKGRFDELAQSIRGINTRLEWIPLDFGEPLQVFIHLGIEEYIGCVAPLVVRYDVDEQRHIVYVSLPFNLLPKSGL
jgi:hypothetical protein